MKTTLRAVSAVAFVCASLMGSLSSAQQPPVNTGTAAETARLAALAGKYDIAGLKLGVPLKEAMEALKAHNPALQMKQDTIRYDDLGGQLLYGLTFTSPNERFVYGLTMPPNPIVVSKIARVLTFTRATAPTQQTIVEGLIAKYGKPSYDNGAQQFNDTNLRILNWLDDANGNRLPDETGQMCISASSFTGIPYRSADAGQTQAQGVAMQLESPWAVGQGDVCETYRMVQARLARCCQSENVLGSPDLVGGLVVLVGDGPLNVQATGATHDFLLNAVKERETRDRGQAEQNRPKL